ncbi:DUF1735 domain-containing protein [Ornithobacterium rhinotracheale]|uniref:DUF1735 and LamG domain-containing protein n=1 Tax=Ornithobacterium rhinotracheale TaxID=28251 RepID=UPI00129D02ED|nr:DUF1735 and LamG domain-containing protein [Ornithobacterium rhinotracheale]MRI62711.1 DUF1735 domain-containing protein [Ornithobacterium rhinotracheale]MRJ09244.1 DUF1735 domain-containing protein [Ornithobacterium rhinotracheale]MRJ09707.1 DUF1735 domain-containing protein [Ornithobacterium rhinotracheale]UOH78801.1 DUF1735 and LamG domain-containing protein [Ornithobacterium rhinotracheale]
MTLKNIFLSIFCLSILFSCDDDNDIGQDTGAGYDQSAALYTIKGSNRNLASTHNAIGMTADVSKPETVETFKYMFSLFKENQDQDVNISINYSPELVEQYNKTYGKDYEALPESKISFSKELKASKGSVNSNLGELNITADNDLQEGKTYMIALTAKTENKNVKVLESAKTLLYTVVRKRGKIESSFELTRENFMYIDGERYIQSLGNSFTMEALVYVNRFRGDGDYGEAGISTLMGTEGAALLRFGDSGVQPNHLQAIGQDIGYDFKTKKWYHIAVVVDGNSGKSTAYVNGKKVMTFASVNTLGEFLIGKSWSAGRGIDAKFAEIRLWKSTRNAQQIKDNMLGIDPTTPGLYAYWKMNEVENNKITDASGHNRNLVLANQSSEVEQKISLTPEDGIEIEP